MKNFIEKDLQKLYKPAFDSHGEENGPSTNFTLSQMLRVCVKAAIMLGYSVFY